MTPSLYRVSTLILVFLTASSIGCAATRTPPPFSNVSVEGRVTVEDFGKINGDTTADSRLVSAVIAGTSGAVVGATAGLVYTSAFCTPFWIFHGFCQSFLGGTYAVVGAAGGMVIGTGVAVARGVSGNHAAVITDHLEQLQRERPLAEEVRQSLVTRLPEGKLAETSDAEGHVVARIEKVTLSQIPFGRVALKFKGSMTQHWSDEKGKERSRRSLQLQLQHRLRQA